MKKVIAMLLSVLMIFSAFSVTIACAGDADADAAEKNYVINFVDYNGETLKSAEVAENSIVKAAPNPTRDSDYDANGKELTRYVFKGWAVLNEDGSFDANTVYHENTIPVATADVTYIAVYSAKDVSSNQTLLQFIKSIFDRINLIFEYFFKIFGGDNSAPAMA